MPQFANLAAAQAGMREMLKYDPVKSQTTEKSALLFDALEAGSPSEINDRNAFIILSVDDAAAIKADATQFADFAPPSNQQQLKTSIPITKVTKTYAVAGAVQRQNAESDLMLLDTIASDIANEKAMFRKQLNFHCHLNGTGEIAKASGVSGNVVTCNSTTNLFGSRHVYKNEILEYRASGVLRTGGGIQYSRVTAVDLSAKTFTVDAIPTDATTNDLVFDYGSYGNWLRGLGYHVNNTGPWQGISDRTAYRGLSSVLVPMGGAYLSRAAFDLVIGELDYKIGDDENPGPRMAYMATGQVAQFKSLGYDLQRYDDPSMSLNTGFLSDALQHGNLAVKGGVDQPLDIVYIGDVMKLMQRFQTRPLGWINRPGAGGDEYMFQANASQGQGHADGLFCYQIFEGNTGVFTPRKVGALTGLGYAGLPSGNLN